MVVFGGLKPITSQVVIDVICLYSFGHTAAATKPSPRCWAVLGAAAGLAIATSGNFTNRWTIIFPMVPYILLQTIRLFTMRYGVKWIERIIRFSSFLLIIISAALSILFPAVELACNKSLGQYNVGIIDMHLPINLTFQSAFPETSHVVPPSQDHSTVRILYPTLDEPTTVPYLRPHTAEDYCEENMKHSAPPPLRPYTWMIHNWRLINLWGKHHASLAVLDPTDSKNDPTTTSSSQSSSSTPLKNDRNREERQCHLFPVVFFSHGLGGSAEMYAYQTHALTKHGYIVVVIDHSDGSAPVVTRKDGSLLRRNESILQHWFDGDKDWYRLLRQTMTDYRSQELLAVVDSFLRLNETTLPELEEVGLDFRNKLDLSNIHYMGHSFGGATAIHAAAQRSPRSLLLHDPASDWIPDTSRLGLFDIERLRESTTNHTYWTSHRDTAKRTSLQDTEDESEVNNGPSSSIHDTTEMLVLFSDEWYQKNYAGVHVLKDMYDRNVLGPTGGSSRLGVIDDAYHQEFSDACMITPLWIARGVGMTGPRNPLDTAREIHDETINFLKDL